MRLMTAAEVGAILNVRPDRVYELVRLGLLPAERLGRQVRIVDEQLEDWIHSGGKGLPGGWRIDE